MAPEERCQWFFVPADITAPSSGALSRLVALARYAAAQLNPCLVYAAHPGLQAPVIVSPPAPPGEPMPLLDQLGVDLLHALSLPTAAAQWSTEDLARSAANLAARLAFDQRAA